VDGVKREFQAIGDAQLIENIVQVILHRLLADEHLFSNLFVPEALRHQTDYLSLAKAERSIFFGGVVRVPAASKRRCGWRRGGRLVPRFTGVHFLYASEQCIKRSLLGQDAGGNAPRRSAASVALGRRQQNHSEIFVLLLEFLEQIGSGRFDHDGIEQQDGGMVLIRELQHLLAVSGFADHGYARLAGKKLVKAGSEDRVPIPDQDTYSVVLVHRRVKYSNSKRFPQVQRRHVQHTPSGVIL
jgi:hypothetical protein